MDDKLNLLQIKEYVNAWIVGRRDELGPIAIKVIDTSDSSLILEANGKLLQIIIPSSFQIGAYNLNSLCSSDEVFLVTIVDSISDRIFENIVTTLNEKLERIKIQSGALGEVLDHLLLALQKFQGIWGQKVDKGSRHPSVSHRSLSTQNTLNEDTTAQTKVLDDGARSQSEESTDESQNEDQESFLDAYDDNSVSCYNVHRSLRLQTNDNAFLYRMAEDAKCHCEIARKNSDMMHLNSTADYYSSLQWCDVNPDFKHCAVHLWMQINEIVTNESAAAALGFSLDSPVKLFLQFGKELWLQESYNPSTFPLKPEKWLISQDTPDVKKDRMHDFDEGMQGVRQSHLYGKDVLLPELIRVYFQYLANRIAPTVHEQENSNLVSELQQFSAMENPFVGLLCFLIARFRSLPDWCVVCWNSLPHSVCRLRSCDRDFCLFRFEELGLGTPVIQEVRKFPELIDFEISLSLAAVASNRDVFEPFPAFLLENDEIRGRSGWFSKLKRCDYSANTEQTASQLVSGQLQSLHTVSWIHKDKEITKSFYENKNIMMLKQVLQSYPPLDVMRECSDEVALKKTLSMFWHKSLKLDTQDVKGKRHNESDGISNWTKNQWLPYDVLRFIILTSRLTLHLLKDDEILDFVEAHYQFAVLHDSPEREAQFESRRTQQGGSFFAFHGSSADNWYSILRNGLRCLSHTTYMSSGAAHGTGIYLASHLSTSMGYCHSKGPGWEHGALGDGFCVLAICEVIDGAVRSDDIPKSGRGFFPFATVPGTSTGVSQVFPCSIMVVPPEFEKDVLIRYILVFKRKHQFEKATHFINKTTLSNNVDLVLHFQNLRSKYGAKQREQQKAFKEADLSSVSVSPKKERALADHRNVDTLLAMPGHVSLPVRTNLEVEQSQNSLRRSTAQVVPAASALQAISKEYKNIIRQIHAAGQKKTSNCRGGSAYLGRYANQYTM